MPTAFISYSHHDRDLVQRLVPDLERAGLDVWWDQELEGGDAFVQAIHDALGKVNYLILVLSPHSVESEWVKHEMNVAFIRTLQRQMSAIIPLLRKDCPIPLAVSDLQYVDFRSPYDTALRKLLAVFQAPPPTPSPHLIPRRVEGFFGQDNVQYRDILPKTMVGKVLRCDLVGNETGRRTR
jgi:hypothetical protein